MLFEGQLIHALAPEYMVQIAVYLHSSLYPPLLSFHLSYFPELFPAFQKVPYSELKRACYNGASTKGRGDGRQMDKQLMITLLIIVPLAILFLWFVAYTIQYNLELEKDRKCRVSSNYVIDDSAKAKYETCMAAKN